jgi:hypothetical protein
MEKYLYTTPYITLIETTDKTAPACMYSDTARLGLIQSYVPRLGVLFYFQLTYAPFSLREIFAGGPAVGRE